MDRTRQYDHQCLLGGKPQYRCTRIHPPHHRLVAHTGTIESTWCHVKAYFNPYNMQGDYIITLSTTHSHRNSGLKISTLSHPCFRSPRTRAEPPFPFQGIGISVHDFFHNEPPHAPEQQVTCFAGTHGVTHSADNDLVRGRHLGPYT